MADKIVFPPMPLIPLFMDASCRAEITSIICARDLEVARVVLEAAASFCDDEYHTGDGWGTTAADRRCAAGIRTLEISHG